VTGGWRRLAADIAGFGHLARVSVVAVAGSAPREPGAALVLRPDGGFSGTIGGGALEWRAIDIARTLLAAGRPTVRLDDVVLGPDLGQCCGGRVTLLTEVFDRTDAEELAALARAEAGAAALLVGTIEATRVRRTIVARDDRPVGLCERTTVVERIGDDRRTVAIFGAGHVGRALVLALAPLPFRILWIDGRADAFPALVPANAQPIGSPDPAAEVAGLPAGSLVVILTHDHALDFAVLDAALRRDDLPHVGVIGSRTKRARFSSRLLQIGHTSEAIHRMVCPIGIPGVESRLPAVIAASVAAELLVADRLARKTLDAGRDPARAGREECA
jgi:xanthine dehydrogenase accessory factor